MRITAIIPSDEWRGAAGVRIRYDRLRPALQRLGHRLDLTPIGELRNKPPQADVCLFSKTYDARAPLLARFYRAQGLKIGIDVFDDYFSQSDDSRFVHLRRWFRSMLPTLDFALCATPRMADRMARLAPALAVHIVNDPAADFSPEQAAATAERNAKRALETNRLDIAWFGIGDNPHFSVGLSDLHAFQDTLAAATRHGFETRLRVMTNRRALTVDRLEMLARMALPVELEEWSEAGEATLIADSLACFLPVNGQSFSTVKSLNRGVTTLAGGAQLLSAGFPLYDRLDEFVYRDVGALVADLCGRKLKLRQETAGRLAQSLAQMGDAEAEAKALAEFLMDRPAPAQAPWPPKDGCAAVIHGQATLGEVHKLAQRLQVLSVAVPDLAAKKLAYDVLLWPEPVTPVSAQGGITVRLSRRARDLLRPEFRSQVRPVRDNGERSLFDLDLSLAQLPPELALEAPSPSATAPNLLVALDGYPGRVALTRAVLETLFKAPEILLSERASPFWGPAAAEPPVAGIT